MRRGLFLLSTILISLCLNAQSNSTGLPNDTLAPYQKNPYIPSFTIRTPDSTFFSKNNLQPKKPTLILYFSPDCGHCQDETERLLSKMKDFNNLQIVMVTSRPFEDMANFANHYMIKRFPSIKIGADSARVVTRFYDVRFTPFSALYDKNGKLIKAYDKGIDMEEMARLTK
jgi:thiol-disulfide isomerase/thioredoxin